MLRDNDNQGGFPSPIDDSCGITTIIIILSTSCHYRGDDGGCAGGQKLEQGLKLIATIVHLWMAGNMKACLIE